MRKNILHDFLFMQNSKIIAQIAQVLQVKTKIYVTERFLNVLKPFLFNISSIKLNSVFFSTIFRQYKQILAEILS